ncbi:C-type lectin domain-containing protein [Caenorhabditis elegans]|uniref:C-type lectin domain-containing protein n=1 Tax=Caenorhabditis elegans TaxID=6239 RepID=Q4R152_CAEEL|nr:C-type lectin domain-containing protein [Caenorhabditis elegans]CCD71147.2 C-type lectin domain-containing protein [Caenorhabditis elegans]|eukprot:NP_001033456.2 C-type LECtin [Caenorhabditis elegans]
MLQVSIFLLFFVFPGCFGNLIFATSNEETCEDDSNNGGGKVKKPCEPGWLKFNRPSGVWCIKVFNGTHSQADAEKLCQKNYGATLSGVQNQREISYVTQQALGTMSQGSGSIWIGAKRTTLCKASRLSKYCNTLTSFQWTDGSASGLDGLIWNNNQPDNNYNRTDQCVVLLAARTPTVSDDLQWGANRLDDCCM